MLPEHYHPTTRTARSFPHTIHDERTTYAGVAVVHNGYNGGTATVHVCRDTNGNLWAAWSGGYYRIGLGAPLDNSVTINPQNHTI